MDKIKSPFKDKDFQTKIKYVIAYYQKKEWYHYVTFEEIEDAKDKLASLRKFRPSRKFALFEEIEQSTINKIDEKSI